MYVCLWHFGVCGYATHCISTIFYIAAGAYEYITPKAGPAATANGKRHSSTEWKRFHFVLINITLHASANTLAHISPAQWSTKKKLRARERCVRGTTWDSIPKDQRTNDNKADKRKIRKWFFFSLFTFFYFSFFFCHFSLYFYALRKIRFCASHKKNEDISVRQSIPAIGNSSVRAREDARYALCTRVPCTLWSVKPRRRAHI